MKTTSSGYINKELARTREPVEWYRIWVEGGSSWYYTSSDKSVTVSGIEYVPATIERTAPRHNIELKTTTMEVTIALAHEPTVSFTKSVAGGFLWVEVKKGFRDQSPIEGSVVYIGQVEDHSFRGKTSVELRCAGLERFLDTEIPPERYGIKCRYMLYDDKCGLTAATYKDTVTVSGISANGLVLTNTDFGSESDDYYTGGYVTFSGHSRDVTAHTSNDVTLLFKIPDLETGDTIDIYPGCSYWIEECDSRFSNRLNYGGCPMIPLHNPATSW